MNEIASFDAIDNIFEGEYLCSCGSELSVENIIEGDIKGTFKCECGKHYILGNEEEGSNLIKYYCEYEEGLKICKDIYHAQLELHNKRYSYKEQNIEKQSLLFKIRNREEGKKLVYIYNDGHQVEYMNECPTDFFREFSIRDFREVAKEFDRLSEDNNIKPNYGLIMQPICVKDNMRNILKFFKEIFTSQLLECLIKEDLEYLIAKNTLDSINLIKANIVKNKNGRSLEEIFKIPHKAIKYIKSKKCSIERIRIIQDFFETRNFYEFNRLVNEENISFHKIFRCKELLDSGYSVDRLLEYAKEISKNENIKLEDVFSYLYDLMNMSRDMQIDFRPYSKNLIERHNKVQEKYKINQNKYYDEKLKIVTAEIKIKQVGEDYICKPLISVEEFKQEGELQKNCVLSYVSEVVKEKEFIVSIRHVENQNKPIATVEIKNNTIVQAKEFANKRVSDEMKKYLMELSVRNGWFLRI